MADFESIIKTYTGEDGSVPAEAIGKLTKAISAAVGNEFVDKARYKAKLGEIDELNGKLQTAEDSLTTAGTWKDKYDTLAGEFESYKGEQAKKEARTAKEAAYKALLKEAGVWEKRIPTVMKVTDIDSLELNAKNELKGAEKLLEGVRTDWADFIETTEIRGANTAFPPANTGGGHTMTKEQIMDIRDTEARQRAISENMALFGLE